MKTIRTNKSRAVGYIAAFLSYILCFFALYFFVEIQTIKGEIARVHRLQNYQKSSSVITTQTTQNSTAVSIKRYEQLGILSDKVAPK